MAKTTKAGVERVSDYPNPPAPPAGCKAPMVQFYVWSGPPKLEALSADPAGRTLVCKWNKARKAWGEWRRV